MYPHIVDANQVERDELATGLPLMECGHTLTTRVIWELSLIKLRKLANLPWMPPEVPMEVP
jgi:hypothetical protein